ncbi:hypothetical protein [Psychroserpens algicola]|uniref:IrrE N-terminal-like domain-containing protein n=1 Tax=Psychroserpens algicola TaxID=1719034 RepID=A0ABT0H755_9FLAO|nr:hypothetical protein [Psychroserpens algicola]MCK8479662.1 hypothetical protein [Psychroserpens algicola]
MMQTTYDEAILNRIVNFINSIQIDVIPTRLNDDTFLPGLHLKGQAILMDKSKLKYPGDLLHEAGHIAVTAPQERSKIGTSEMEKSWPCMGDEIAAILWSYAALHHLNLNPDVVFHPNGYRDASNWFIEQFTSEVYMGLPLLVWMEFCDTETFPKMKKWLR